MIKYLIIAFLFISCRYPCEDHAVGVYVLNPHDDSTIQNIFPGESLRIQLNKDHTYQFIPQMAALHPFEGKWKISHGLYECGDFNFKLNDGTEQNSSTLSIYVIYQGKQIHLNFIYL